MPYHYIIIAEVYINIHTHKNEWYMVSHAQNMSPLSKKHGKEGALRCSLAVLLLSIRSALIENVICWCKTWLGKESKRVPKTNCKRCALTLRTVRLGPHIIQWGKGLHAHNISTINHIPELPDYVMSSHTKCILFLHIVWRMATAY